MAQEGAGLGGAVASRIARATSTGRTKTREVVTHTERHAGGLPEWDRRP